MTAFRFAFLTALLLIATPSTAAERPYRIDLTHYFQSANAELDARKSLFAEVDVFASTRLAPHDAAALNAYLERAQSLLAALSRHDDYLLLKYSTDIHDRASVDAESGVSAQWNRVQSSTAAALLRLPQGDFAADVQSRPGLARFSYMMELVRRDAAHALAPDQQLVVDTMGAPTLSDLYDLYNTTLRSTPFAKIATKSGPRDSREDQKLLAADADPAVRAAARKAFFAGYVSREPIYAAILLDIVAAKTRLAKLAHFASAPDQKYFASFMTVADVKATLAAIKAQSSLFKHYRTLESSHIAAQTGLKTVHSWDLAAPLSGFAVPHFTVEQVRADAHGALAPLGADYVSRIDALLNPENRRFDIATGDENRDAGGFSVGQGGAETALFVGDYNGQLGAANSLIHEAGHAIHRGYMNANHLPAFYADGPHWMMEAFAILNEFLLDDHLSRVAADPRAKAYYLNALVDEMTFQLYGSAEEGTLEQAIYDGAASGRIKTGADLDALTLSVLSDYEIWHEAERGHIWMAKSLMYMDPLYLVNYLYAGLLAIKLYEMALDDPADFQRRYIALLSDGFCAPPEVLLAKFFGRKVATADLIPGAVAIVKKKTDELQRLYAVLDRH